MSSLNKVTLIGSLGADPEVRSFQNGGRVCNLRLATSESWKDKSTGERKEKTEWHSVAIFSDGIVNVAEKYLRKGSKVYLEGQLQTRKWQDQSGNDRYSTEVVLQGFDSKLVLLGEAGGNRPQSQQQERPQQQRQQRRDTFGNGGGFPNDLDDDIPF